MKEVIESKNFEKSTKQTLKVGETVAEYLDGRQKFIDDMYNKYVLGIDENGNHIEIDYEKIHEEVSTERQVLEENKILRNQNSALKKEINVLKEKNNFLEREKLETETKFKKLKKSLDYVSSMTANKLKLMAVDMELYNDKNFGERMKRKIKEVQREKESPKIKQESRSSGMEY